jgi:eukaryotic-like serine/threonine-protein kinase
MDEPVPGYVLHHRIGAGAGAEVFRAEPVGAPGRLVAVKRLRVPPPQDALDRFRRQAVALAAVSHPGVLPLLDLVEVDGRVALVFPHAVGGSLADRLAITGGGLPPVEVAALGARLAEALAAVHDAGCLHRGVTPGNVLFDAEGQPALGDVGTGLLTDGPAPADGAGVELDPAVRAGARPDARSDLHGLGVTLRAALSGLGSDTDTDATSQHDAVPEATASLLAALAHATEPDPAARHATARELAADLTAARRAFEQADRGAELPAGRDVPPARVPSLPRRPRAGVLGARPVADAAGPPPRRPASPAPRPSADLNPRRSAAWRDRRALVVVAAAVLAVPLGLVWTFADGDAGPAITENAADTTVETIVATDDTAVAGRPVCRDRPTPELTGELHPADLEGRGCTVLVGWDGQHLHVPHADGTVDRYDLGGAPGDVLLVGDWNCDGHDTLAFYRPDDGQLFVFDTVAEEATARGQATGVTHGRPAVVTGTDGCAQVRVGPAS